MAEDPRKTNFDYGDKDEDGQYENYPVIEEGHEPEFKQEPRKSYIHEKCGVKTTMRGELPESIARDPTWYDKTFCYGCKDHVPVEEVHWEDGNDWVVGDN